MIRTSLVRGPIDVPRLLSAAGAARHGAVVSFSGTVREQNDGRAVSGIEYSAYEPMAAAELGRIADEARLAHGADTILVEHRLGILQVGEVSVAIVVADPHRAPALRAMEQVIEELKRRVPIWKREHYLDGTREWVDPTRSTSSGASTATSVVESSSAAPAGTATS